MVSLKYDTMHIGSKIKCNPHTMEVDRFANDSFNFNVLSKECDALNGIDEDEEENKLEYATLYLVFMILNWKNMKQMKRVVARYSLGSGISSYVLVGDILNIIVALVRHGLIINHGVGYGAAETEVR